MGQQTGLAAPGEHLTFDADDCGDVRMPVAADELVGRVEDTDGAALVAVASGVMAMSGGDRGRGGGDLLDLLVEGRLVVLDLDDQGGTDFGGDLEDFFWQCKASSVTMAPSATPSSVSSICAAGISFDFSSISTWARMRDVSVANALSTWLAARSRKLSKLPRSVLPSSAMLPLPGVARAACSRAAWRRNAVSTSAGSRPLRIYRTAVGAVAEVVESAGGVVSGSLQRAMTGVC